jgi:choline/ethanolamine kinase
LRAAADRVPGYLAEIEQVPLGTAHGDACTNNLLVQRDSADLMLIDYGFWTTQPLGFDLSQLIIGDVQIGRRAASCLWRVEEACTPAYVDGLRDEGSDVPADQVRRCHALLMLLFSGLSALPIEHLDATPTPELHRIAAERAAAARFILDLVDATA